MAGISIVEYPFEARVLVATWPDGVSLWRKVSRPIRERAGKTFCFQGLSGEPSFVIHGRHVGIILEHQRFDLLVDHGRWVLQALEVKERTSSPVWGTVKKEDPLVTRLTMTWSEALERAKLLDDEIDHVFASAGINEKNRFRWKSFHDKTFNDICETIPENKGLVTRVETFLANLLDGAWLSPGGTYFRNNGDLRPVIWTPPENGPFEKNISEGPVNLRWTRTKDFNAHRPREGWSLTYLLQALKMQPTGLVVKPEFELSRWIEEHEVKGELTLSEDEIELYRMLGEKIPFLWPDPEFFNWAKERA